VETGIVRLASQLPTTRVSSGAPVRAQHAEQRRAAGDQQHRACRQPHPLGFPGVPFRARRALAAKRRGPQRQAAKPYGEEAAGLNGALRAVRAFNPALEQQRAVELEGSESERWQSWVKNMPAAVELQHQHVMRVKGGQHFGFNMICSCGDRLDKERYPVTVITETMCQILVVTRTTYQHALHRYPEMVEVARQCCNQGFN